MESKKSQHKKTGFINGCFDILHIGHKRLFQFAKEQCDELIVAIDSDTRVAELKGTSRPYNSENIRKEMLESLVFVDTVLIFSSEKELINLIKNLSPDIMVIGSDYKNKEVIGRQYAKQLIFFERVGDYSTSKIIENIGCG